MPEHQPTVKRPPLIKGGGARASALRIGEALVLARLGNFYDHGWYSYIDRHDVETLVKETLEPTEVGVYERLVRQGADHRRVRDV